MILAPFLPTRADHRQRAFKKFTHIDGEVCLSDIFDPILRKVRLISIGSPCRSTALICNIGRGHRYRKRLSSRESTISCAASRRFTQLPQRSYATREITFRYGWTFSRVCLSFKYSHISMILSETALMYCLSSIEQFSNLCTITADVSNVPKYPQKGPLGRYYSQSFSIVLSFGLTELKAHIAWVDKVRTIPLSRYQILIYGSSTGPEIPVSDPMIQELHQNMIDGPL